MLSDECYDELTFDAPLVSPASLGHEAAVITVYSFSKTYAMTGWRVGYAVVPRDLADHLAKVQEPLISCVNAVAQHAALAAVTGPQQCVADMLAAYRARLEAAVKVAAERSLGYVRPGGAFYLWVDVRGAGATAHDLALDLLRHHRVAVAPGTAFGDEGEGWVRMSLANSEEAIRAGVAALADTVGVCSTGSTLNYIRVFGAGFPAPNTRLLSSAEVVGHLGEADAIAGGVAEAGVDAVGPGLGRLDELDTSGAQLFVCLLAVVGRQEHACRRSPWP